MLPEQKWRADAVVRLLISIFACIYAGSLLGALVQKAPDGPTRTTFLWVSAAALVSLGATLVLIRTPLTRENLTRRLGATMVCFYIGMMLGAWAHKLAGSDGNSVLRMVISALSFQGATIVLIGLFVREQQARWVDCFGLASGTRNALLIGLGLGVAFLPVGWALQVVSAALIDHLPQLNFKSEEQQAVQTLRLASTVWHKTALAVTTIALAPIAEELLFRGVLYKWIRDAGFPQLALWGLSILFAAIHLNAVTFAPLFCLSILLTMLYERKGNLLTPIAAHAAFNATNFGLLYILQHKINQPV